MTLIFMLFFRFINESKANDITVVDVRRNITLAEDDKVYKDFYINAGVGSGLKKNLVITAVRKINIRDASGANAVGEILVPVGQLKVIAVYEHVAVAREFTLLSRDELPMLEQIGIMNGDHIDLQGSFIDNTKPKAKLKTAQEAVSEKAVAVVTVAPAPVVSAKVEVKTETVVKESSTPRTPSAANPVPSANNSEKLEKTADSGNKSLHE
ncbi:MAG: hypothetical protein ACXVCY_11245 [Pseudobdellovibrionaceae bacterium]